MTAEHSSRVSSLLNKLREHWVSFLDEWEMSLKMGAGSPISALNKLFKQIEKEGPICDTTRDMVLSRLNRALYATYIYDDLNNSWWSWLEKESPANTRVFETVFGPLEATGWGVKRVGHDLHCDPICLPPIGSIVEAVTFHIVQQRIFLLADHWEHHNVVLAVEQNSLLKSPCSTEEKSLKSIEISKRRDWLIGWVFSCLLKVDTWLEKALPSKDISSDTFREWEATRALSMACQQKLLLPATVSRHVYSCSIFKHMFTWSSIGIKLHPDDLSFSILYSLLNSLFTGKTEELNKLFNILLEHDHVSEEYSASFDVGVSLKAICWAWDHITHGVLTACLILHFGPRVRGGVGSELNFIHTLCDFIQMPKTFPKYALPTERESCKFPPELNEIAKKILHKSKNVYFLKNNSIGGDIQSYINSILSRL